MGSCTKWVRRLLSRLGATAALVAALGLLAATACAQTSNVVQGAQRDFSAGNYAVAISKLQPLVTQSSSNAEAFFWLGRSYYEISDYDSAIAQFEKAVLLGPKNSLYQEWLGRAYGGKADRDRSFSLAKKVKKQFELAVTLNPSNIEARRDLEEYCLDAPWIVGGSKDEAWEQVNAIAALDPVQGHLARAFYDREVKKPEDAENELRQVLAADPRTPDPYLEAAQFFQNQNMPSDMSVAIEAAARVSPNDPRLAYYRGVEGVLGNTNLGDAERDLKAYLASTPERSDWPSHASARDWLGRLYEAEGKRPEAAEQYRAALQLDPKSKDAEMRLSRLEKSK
jgi:tetratricopeptide (TPR) repeat protein